MYTFLEICVTLELHDLLEINYKFYVLNGTKIAF